MICELEEHVKLREKFRKKYLAMEDDDSIKMKKIKGGRLPSV